MNASIICMGIFLFLNVGPQVQSWDFDDVPEGQLPKGWRVEATGQDKPAAQWAVKVNKDAPLGPGVLQLTATNHSERGVFNICWSKDISFYEGQIAVFLKANSGRIDQGGGPIWRVQDRNNYYIARYNPLEQNVSIYYVKAGRRVMLGYTGRLILTDGWHILKISHSRGRIRTYLDGDMKLMVNAGDYIPKPGGVGLWTKADAATSFDNFTVIKP
ncbi:hypothetical protein GWN26_06840 [Candidatus Saccharibacteria bacterium]|nr:hypothetical protein [Candidatus Saccharibacteria bacterium]